MARFAALLRGVNVGPTTKVPMAELREVIEELGGTDVKTLLNSGNVVFQLHASPKVIDDMVSEAVSKRFGFQIDVVCRTKKQLESVLAHDPLGDVATDDSKYLILFLPKPPKAAAVKPVLAAEHPGGEQCALKGREFYIWTPNGVSKSKSAEAFGKSKAVDFATGRNVRTLKKLIEIL
ncbi:MAG: DUF1697 domain-containing protein [Solirubrobacterales bacterium]